MTIDERAILNFLALISIGLPDAPQAPAAPIEIQVMRSAWEEVLQQFDISEEEMRAVGAKVMRERLYLSAMPPAGTA